MAQPFTTANNFIMSEFNRPQGPPPGAVPPPAYAPDAEGSSTSTAQYQRPAVPPPGHPTSNPFTPASAEQEKQALKEKYKQEQSQPQLFDAPPQTSQYTDHDYETLLPSIIKSLNRLQNPELWLEYLKSTRKKSSFKKMFGGSKSSYTDQDFAQIASTLIPSRKTHNFYTSRDQLIRILRENNALAKLHQIKQNLQIPPAFPMDELAQLLFFDIVLFVDNSGSMANVKRQTEFKTLMLDIMKTISIKNEGFALRFMNKNDQLQQGVYQDTGISFDNIQSEDTVRAILNSPHVGYFGVTPLATKLYENVIKPFVLQRVPAKRLAKPVLVVVLTDGMPYGEQPPFTDKDGIAKIVKQTRQELVKGGYAPGSVLYQFAQVGDDRQAADYLNDLDDDKDIGDLIDVTNVFEKEKVQLNNDVADRVFYLKKLILGPIDELFDKADEQKK
ncbi:hypothetical protein BABINDRAFT_160626 [Babjeviella inositovora NRRL Y-12698]|uniref:VWFA domain-containing protein n=1 Tax=Babjeviella inositovora NRRL Y-12698 TaxID=984486 RepID=A0A1E3QUA0_9ASCO|nr:uncharacterized protein BABINDRAFT_160626 [Babjeviella inositovora NRRL Y-12698]ODQ81249.1 hypothetical protein BABINDRAFT_160626 [Babjeviella inositovora NRRL Y-12698]